MQISIKMYILVSSFAVTLCTVTDALLANYDLNGDFAYHHRNRQVSSTCIKTEDECFHSSQCCSDDDVCVMDAKLSMIAGRRVGICRNLEYIRAGVRPSRFEGDTCEDSSECFEGCCITIRRHRYGILQVCARENGPFMCVMGLNELTDELTRRR